jgi:hypothetical protein
MRGGSWPERFYRALLVLYPQELRWEYADEMARVFRQRWQSESRPHLLITLTADALASSIREHLLVLWNDLR